MSPLNTYARRFRARIPSASSVIYSTFCKRLHPVAGQVRHEQNWTAEYISALIGVQIFHLPTRLILVTRRDRCVSWHCAGAVGGGNGRLDRRCGLGGVFHEEEMTAPFERSDRTTALEFAHLAGPLNAGGVEDRHRHRAGRERLVALPSQQGCHRIGEDRSWGV